MRGPGYMQYGLAGAALMLIAAGGAPVLAQPATSAAEGAGYVLANSTLQKLEVDAEGGEAWCGRAVRLRMMLAPDSPVSGDAAAQVVLMNRLNGPLASACAAAETAQLSVVRQGKQEGSYQASKAGGWSFAAVPSTPAASSITTAAGNGGAPPTQPPTQPPTPQIVQVPQVPLPTTQQSLVPHFPANPQPSTTVPAAQPLLAAGGERANSSMTWVPGSRISPMLNPGVVPPTPPSGPATTPPAAGTCGCPHITPLATSDKPDPHRAEFEYSANDLDWEFSNRLSRFDGDWNAALGDLARAIDATGSLQLASGPAPKPAANAPVLVEGDFSKFLISGLPDAKALPLAPQSLPGSDPKVAMQGFLYGRVTGLVVNLLSTIARSDKYGEPAFGVRDAALHWLRFLIEDLGRMPMAQARSGSPTAGRVAMVRTQALYVLVGIIEQAVRPDARWRESPRSARIHAMLRHPDAPAITDAPATGLALDTYDLASAALDVLISVDSKKQTTGLLEFMGRPGHFDANGAPMSQADEPPEGATNVLLVRALIQLAALHSRFGGPAPSGSPAEAVSCKALSVLTGLSDRKLAHSAALRRLLWIDMISQTATLGVGANKSYNAPRYRAERAAALLAGVLDVQEAKLILPAQASLANIAFVDAYYRGAKGGGPSHADFQDDLTDALHTISDMTQYATGPGASALAAQVNAHQTRVRNTLTAAQGARDATWNDPAPNPVVFGPGFPDASTIPRVMIKEERAALINSAQGFLDVWAQASPDISAPEWQALCPPAPGPPQVVVIALGARRDFIIDRFYPGVPTAIDLVFDEAYSGDSYPVTVEDGGTLELTAVPLNGDHRLFRTPAFLPGQR